MANPSPLPNSYSPKDQHPRSAFQWPAPLSPRSKQEPHDTTVTNTDLPLKDILEKYKDDADILRHILLAKAEEDKRQAARDMLKTEQARIHLKQLDLEYLREQSRLPRYYDKTYSHSTAPVLPPPPLATATTSSATVGSALPPPASATPYYALAPVQQQVLARLTGSHSTDPHYSSSYSSHYEYQPSSPVAYPHSAHPLCPPTEVRSKNATSTSSSTTSARYNSNHQTNTNKSTSTTGTSSSHHYRHRLQPPSINTSTSAGMLQPSTPISPAVSGVDDAPANNAGTTLSFASTNTSTSSASRYKRNRHSVSDQSDDKLSHNKVMEALKAKIQRGNGSPVSATSTSSLPYRSSFADSLHMDKRQRQLPKPIVPSDANGSNATSVSIGGGNSNGCQASSSVSSCSSPPTTTSPSTAATHTPSPRSAKPVLPPIDTSVGQHHQQLHTHHHRQQEPRHRSSSPSHIPSNLTSKKGSNDNTPTATQISPSDQVLALNRQERNNSYSATSSDNVLKQESE